MTTSMEALSDRPMLIYLATQSDGFLMRFFESQACVAATFRMLTPVAQKCFVNLFYQQKSDWKTWPKKRHILSVYQALRLLMQLKIVGGELEGELYLNNDFQMNYLASIMCSSVELSGLHLYAELDERMRRKAADKDLYKSAVERWELILKYLALPSSIDNNQKSVSQLTRDLFIYNGFVKEGTNKETEISSVGFHFLLLNKVEQMWTYLIYFFKYIEESCNVDVFPVVEFLLKLLLFVSVNNDDETLKSQPIVIDATWPDDVKQFITHLRDIGLIFMRKRKDGFFFLTPLLRILAISEGCVTFKESSADAMGGSSTNCPANAGVKGFLIVETNFRVYAYTDSSLHLAILSTFTEFSHRFHDVVVGIMTRESVRRALQAGITAKQIVQYLKSNAHPQAILSHGRAESIPLTVTDQIHLWEQERQRLVCDEATLYSAFDSEAEFIALRDFAAANNVLKWHCNVQKLVVVGGGPEGDQLVRDWWRSQMG